MSIDAQRRVRETHARGCSGREIARSLGISRNTVAKYVGKGGFSPAPPVARESRRPSIDPYAGNVRSWLEADAGALRRQRHTARRACDRLVAEEGCEGSLSTVERFAGEWREARRGPGDGFLELEWPAGSAQAGHGECFADIGGARERPHALVVSFPRPDARLEAPARAQRSENACWALAEALRAIGRAPRELVLDNATECGRRVGDAVRESALFSALRAHYDCSASHRNPPLGPREGVGRERRRVPPPEPDGAGPGGGDARGARRPPARGLPAADVVGGAAGRGHGRRALRGGPGGEPAAARGAPRRGGAGARARRQVCFVKLF